MAASATGLPSAGCPSREQRVQTSQLERRSVFHGPGLYELQVQVGTPDVLDICGDKLLKFPAALPLRVLGP